MARKYLSDKNIKTHTNEPMTESATTTAPLTVHAAAHARRSVRQYAPEPIPRAALQQILETLALAPSAFNVQPWRVVVVEEPALKTQLAAVAYNQRQVTSAPTVLVFYTDMADVMATVSEVVHPGMPADQQANMQAMILKSLSAMNDHDRAGWGAVQGNIGLGFLLLAAAGLGYQTSAMAGFQPEGVKQLLGLPASAHVNALVAIGTGTEPGFPHHRHPVARFTTFR